MEMTPGTMTKAHQHWLEETFKLFPPKYEVNIFSPKEPFHQYLVYTQMCNNTEVKLASGQNYEVVFHARGNMSEAAKAFEHNNCFQWRDIILCR